MLPPRRVALLATLALLGAAAPAAAQPGHAEPAESAQPGHAQQAEAAQPGHAEGAQRGHAEGAHAGHAPAARPDPEHAGAADDDATVTHGFEDAERWAEVFDDPGRDAWQKPEEVARALAIRPGDVVADVGAGTGYFNATWSRAVGEAGVVLAVDVEPALVAHMRDRAEQEGTANVVPVLASADDPRLPRGLVDLAVFVNSVHHIGDRRDYFRRLRRALAPGGRIAVIDWRKQGEMPVGPPPEHRLAADQVVRELEAAGYAQTDAPGLLPYQYVRVFRRADEPGP